MSLSQEGGVETLEVHPGELVDAFERALDNRSRGLASRLRLHPGVYREAISVPTERSVTGTEAITLEAVVPGQAIISGADVFTNWQCEGGLCTHAWPYDWGASPNPYDAIDVPELARRRELVVVNGDNLPQVLSHGALKPGSFFVDEANDKLYLYPPQGVNLAAATVEVGVRDVLYKANSVSHVTLRGLHFRHAASAFERSAVEIGASHMLLDRVMIAWNGQVGLTLRGKAITVLASVMNHNGNSGLTAYKGRNLLLEDTEASHNNWRGHSVGYVSWDVGNKFARVHDVAIYRHKAVGNFSRGLWFDWDIEDVWVEELYACDNLVDGLHFEAAQGPITIKNSTFCNNGEYGVLANGAFNVTLENNRLEYNALDQLHLARGRRSLENWETGETYDLLGLAHWTVTGNTFSAQGAVESQADPILFNIRLYEEEWRHFLKTSTLNRNTYQQPDADAMFRFGGEEPLSFAEWQKATGSEGESKFNGD